MNSSLVAKAKTALHSAAAKAEKVLTDIKADLKNDRGNLCSELWENARPIPSVKQAPIYDEDLAVEDIFNHLDEATPVEIFQQLLFAALSAGFTIVEAVIPTDSEAAKLLTECKQYVISTCQSELNSENIENLCQVYAAVEKLSAHPEEASSMKDKSDDREQRAKASV